MRLYSYAPFVPVKVKTNGSKEVFTLPTQNSTQTYEITKNIWMRPRQLLKSLMRNRGFVSENDGRTSLVFCARVDKELGFLLLSAYPGILVRTSYVPMVADYCQRITPEVGVVCVESNLCEVYYRTEVAFEHAPVSRATLELLERTAFAALTPHISALRSLSAGVLPEALPEPQEIHIPSPAPSHAEDFLPWRRNIFKKRTLPCLQNMRPMKPARATSTSFSPRTAAGSCTSP